MIQLNNTFWLNHCQYYFYHFVCNDKIEPAMIKLQILLYTDI